MIATELMMNVEQVAIGEFVKRKQDSQKVFTRGTYCRETKRYSLVDSEDVSREVFVKKGTMVFVGFTY